MKPARGMMIGLAVVVLWAAAGAPLGAYSGTIEGRIELTMGDGATVHGDWIRVMLVTEPVDVAAIRQEVDAQIAEVGGGRQGVRTNRLNLEFYKQVMARITGNPGYVTASTLTTEDGTFKFTGVAPGSYWVLITFPSIIAGYKVTWQVPVSLPADPGTVLILNEANLLFPLELPH